ncbi:unnamed protein product [Spirodela intermedia]|uniref:Uncharacterized protein n=1 Tax=Spirodela intermedia TaxID=51605 RepID=A0A7I8JCV3_SPIIN|nr:unnamed protein product [Spirodela intermedia]CAA6667821.1 unnamed protein product [Spirodela intermedia]
MVSSSPSGSGKGTAKTSPAPCRRREIALLISMWQAAAAVWDGPGNRGGGEGPERREGRRREGPIGGQCGWTDHMVVATGKSAWHVRNIAQALVYKAKQKQKGANRMLLPSIEGHQGGNWIVVDDGSVVVHALDEKARSYYKLENLWTEEKTPEGPNQDLKKAFMKIRPKNNSKKRGEKLP